MTPLFEENRLYTSKEVLDITKISLSTLHKLEDSGILKAVRISERIKRFIGGSLNKVISE